MALFVSTQNGCEAALGDLLVLHLPQIRTFVRMLFDERIREVEGVTDVVQSVCREVLAHPQRLEFRGEREFRSWLYCAVMHRIRHKVRHHQAQRRDLRRRVPYEQGLAFEQCISLLTPSRMAAAVEELQRFEAACAALPKRQRQVLAMARIAGMTHEEIAGELGCTPDASRKLLHRALSHVSVVLERADRRAGGAP